MKAYKSQDGEAWLFLMIIFSFAPLLIPIPFIMMSSKDKSLYTIRLLRDL